MSGAPFSLDGKHVLVIGASSGIGEETARQCARAGATVSVCARRGERLEALVRSLGGGTHRSAVLDVRATPSIAPCLDVLAREGGPFDGLVYAAGVAPLVPLVALSEAALADVLATNLTGAILSTKAALRKASKEAFSAVWISSVAPRRPGGAGMTAYAASKAGMDGAVAALAVELARRNGRVNSIAAGAVETAIWESGNRDPEQKAQVFGRHPLGPGRPEDVALACVYLLSPAARWVTGTTLTLDGGFSVA